MTRVEQPSDKHGSLRDIQLLINKNTGLIDKHIKAAFAELTNDTIVWQSPLSEDKYAEYRDNEFIKKVGLDRQEIKLEEFWPSRGPQWDALATTADKRIILVEAKANIPEVVSSPQKRDKSVNDPETEGEWKAALQVLYSYLGLSKHKLSKYMADIFINVNDLKK